MEYLCTICSKEKRADKEALPALERYLSKRIWFVYQESLSLKKPMLILSGKYGLLYPTEPIPWYDQKLTEDGINDLMPIVTKQIYCKKISELLFYCKPETNIDWLPYHKLLKMSCSLANVRIAYNYLDCTNK